MCNINIIRSKGRFLSQASISCINTMGFMSSIHNRDGAGMLARTPRGDIAISHNPKGKVRVVGGYDLVATHQRLSTSGHNGRNTHPFVRKHFALMHNGVFSELGDKEKSDTAKYCDLLEDALKDSGDIVKAIQEVHRDITGSFSIFLYDRDKKRFLYYKNTSTSFYGLSHPLYDIYSTDEDNLEFAKWFLRLKDTKKIEFEPDKIYELETKKVLGEIKEKEIPIAPEEETQAELEEWFDGRYHYSDRTKNRFDWFGY